MPTSLRRLSTGALTAALLLTATAGAASATASAQSSSSGSSGSSGSSLSSGSSGSAPSEPDVPWAESVTEGLNVTLVGDVLGPGISDHLGILSGDLGIMASLGPGDEFAIIFGDSFRGKNLTGGWLSPVGFVARLDEDGRIELLRPLNEGEVAEQLIKYRYNDRGLTIIPSDIINLDGTLYMQGMWNEGIGNVLKTEIWTSTDDGATWTSTNDTKPAGYLQGMGQLITWELGPDGYVYIMSTGFQRDDPVFLARTLPTSLGDRDTWQYYTVESGAWGTKATPILDTAMEAGEMSLRHIDGHWVLAMFNQATMAIEVRVSEEIARDWDEITPANVVVSGFGGWGAPQTPDNFTQLYGGYIVPGSTLDDLDLVVSQWNTSDNSRYMATQFNVTGLDTFFGTDADATAGAHAPMTVESGLGDQSVIETSETAVDPGAEKRLTEELIMEDVTALTVIPLDDAL